MPPKCCILKVSEILIKTAFWRKIVYISISSIALKNTEYAKAQCSTIRTKFIKIAALIVSNSRKIIFKIASYFPY
ncbi:transposase [Candidatus Dependentiae bacterium]|nr:transposase [Candidatus Dependentiae bacterium]